MKISRNELLARLLEQIEDSNASIREALYQLGKNADTTRHLIDEIMYNESYEDHEHDMAYLDQMIEEIAKQADEHAKNKKKKKVDLRSLDIEDEDFEQMLNDHLKAAQPKPEIQDTNIPGVKYVKIDIDTEGKTEEEIMKEIEERVNDAMQEYEEDEDSDEDEE